MPLTDGRILGAPPLPTSPELLNQVSTEQHALLTRRQCLTAGMSDKSGTVTEIGERARATTKAVLATTLRPTEAPATAR